MKTPIKPSRILVAEDDDEFRLLLLSHLRDAGHIPIELEDGGELSDYIALTRTQLIALPDLILTDLRMPGPSGLEVVRKARDEGLTCPIVLLTAFPAPEVFEEADRIGHITVLGKPIEFERITECVSDLVSRSA
jgi:CheY-like chemotaxis protein